MNGYFLTFLLAATPVIELRGAIPLGIFAFGLQPLNAFIISVLGNMAPVAPLLIFWHYLADKLAARFHIVHRCKQWWFGRVEDKHARNFELLKDLALVFFVAVPLPLTGAWSGTVAAYVFKIPFWRSVFLISLGVLISGLIVLGGSMFAGGYFGNV